MNHRCLAGRNHRDSEPAQSGADRPDLQQNKELLRDEHRAAKIAGHMNALASGDDRHDPRADEDRPDKAAAIAEQARK